ncbi:MAG: DUF4190 domain-containing protein [Actinobacteria bacterium]|nr:DUF4190 domain-containing protein [Actinomycetota bacterium]
MTDPWGNPLPAEDQPKTAPRPEPRTPEATPNPAWPGYPAPPQPAPAQPTWQGPKFSGLAIAAMVCGILSITCTGFVGIILGPTALGLGINGRRVIARSNGWKKGDGMATTGIVLGVIGIVFSIVYLIFLLKNPNFITDFVNNLTTTTTTAGKLQGA